MSVYAVRVLVPLMVLALTIGVASWDVAAQDKGKGATKKISFKVPLRGAPKMRVGGGVRSADALDVAVNVLAPEEAGYTTSDKPTVYWYLSDAVSEPVEIAITDTTSLEVASKPLLDVTLPGPIEAGVHAFRLADHGVTLKEGVEYQWFVAVVKDPQQRSKDIIAGGSIVYSPATQALRDELGREAETIPAIAYAEFGMWCDAVDDLSRRIDANPADAEARALRAELVEQVGLEEAAAYDRGGA